jgi:hypothetical protein
MLQLESPDEKNSAGVFYHILPQSHNCTKSYRFTSNELTLFLQAMIADLKADSERWEQERRATALRGQTSNSISFRDSDGIILESNTPIVEYRASTTHQTRQYYGPTEAAPGAQIGYPAAASAATSQGAYDSSAQAGYPGPSYAQPSVGYAQPQAYAVQNTNYYDSGADMSIAGDQRGLSARPRPQDSTTLASQQPESHNLYSRPGPPDSSTQYASQQTDPHYGRGTYHLQLFYSRRNML